MPKLNESQYIIAIGASAGGLEAIAAFFDHTPLDAVSYILIQHLSPNFKSQMVEILARHSKLEIIEATDNVEVLSNKIYLVPSSNYMSITEGRLLLSDKKDKVPPHLTINYFFKSLAIERGSKAIGVILSGTGNDGAEGIEAIKDAGGLVIVQDKKTAQYDGMPLAAIATGAVDLILSPGAMPNIIEEYVKHGNLSFVAQNLENEISDQEISQIINLIKEKLPLDFTDYKRPTILRRIKRRMAQHDITGVEKYTQLLKNDNAEIEILAKDFLIGVTSFFRDKDAFEIIEQKVLPDIINNVVAGDFIKVWVAGCATGEEAYSLAILIREYLDKINNPLEVKIFATDINKINLDIASKGIYNSAIEKEVSPSRISQYFDKQDDGAYKIKHEIRQMLIFAQHDLVRNPPYCNIDLISCRNLLIYMNTVLQRKVFSMLHFGLKKNGYLFLGPSENAAILKTDFIEISNKWNVYKSDKSGRGVRFDTFSSPVIESMKTSTNELRKKKELPILNFVISEEINAGILEESGMSGVCTDEHFKVIQSFGDLSPYLKKEIFNLDLIDLLPNNISIALKATAHNALKKNERFVIKNLHFSMNGFKATIADIVIKPFISKANEKLLLVLFAEHYVENTDNNLLSADIDTLTKNHLIELEEELLVTKNNLELAYERIESSNENLQSFNEELLSANEEMQSANEELQSVNEELETINKEHQATNAALTELNDDLNNYFRSNVNGQLFVDENLLLRKYSPKAITHINIRESDIGRPLSNITTNIKFETIIEDIKIVIKEGNTIVKEAESFNGRIYQVMTMPYIRQSTQSRDGAVISFFDITELKKILRELDISNKSLLRINADLNNFVYGASHDLTAPILNIEMVLGILNDKINSKDEEVITLSEMMIRSINKFKGVIKDLAQVGTIESEMLRDSENENFIDLFNDIQDAIAEKIKHSGTVFKTNFQVEIIQFPKKYLRSILLNLITNAMKFSSGERIPEITITTQLVPDFILLTVKDNGIGIAKDKTDFIFNMYQRINNDVEGQGIGLFLIKKVVDAAGGKIEVESELNKGSTFKVYFKND